LLIVLVGLTLETQALFILTTLELRIISHDVKLFLLKQTYKSFLFLSETMDFLVGPAVPLWTVSSKPSSQPIWPNLTNPSGWRSKPMVTYLTCNWQAWQATQIGYS